MNVIERDGSPASHMEQGSQGISPGPAPSPLLLFLSFLKLGLTAFGGPPMVSYIREMVVERKRWITPSSFQDGVALSQTIPGIISMQTAAYAGLKIRELQGPLHVFWALASPLFSP